MNSWINLRTYTALAINDTAYRELDDLSQRVLEWACTQYDSKSNLFVQAIVLESKIASPATIHKCLATLGRTDFLNFEVDPEDARRRIVSPTTKALKTLNTLSKQVDKWALKNS